MECLIPITLEVTAPNVLLVREGFHPPEHVLYWLSSYLIFQNLASLTLSLEKSFLCS